MAEIIKDMSELGLKVTKNSSSLFLISLTLIVMSLGLGVVRGVVGENPQLSLATQGERGPASIQPFSAGVGEVERLKDTVRIVDLGCIELRKKRVILVKEQMVRLVGKRCGDDKHSSLQSIANRSNGVQGTTFNIPSHPGVFSTDYMYLGEGTNNLLLEFSGHSRAEAKVFEVTLNRRISQSD